MRAAGAVAGLAAAPCSAQVMDYGGLEAMFGEPVTVSATGSPQKAADAPVAMEIITADQIRRSGADNIPAVLRQVSGVDIRQYGATDFDVGIRGYNSPNSPRVLVLLNGRQLYIDYYTYTAWATVPVQLEEIRQIEVIKGPNSALYGFNAVGGVINIVTYDPVFDSPNEVTFRAGSHGAQQVSGVGSVKLGERAGLRISASEKGAHEFKRSELPEVIGPYPDSAASRTIYAHGRAVTPSGVDLTGEFDTGEARQFEMTIGGWPASTRYFYNREKLGAGTESKLGYLNLNAYRNWVGYNYLAGFNCAACTEINNTLYVVQASDLMKPAADHTVRLGLEYRNNRAEGTIFGYAKLGFDLYATNAMWNWQVSPTVSLINSVRLDHMVTVFDGVVNPAIRYSAAQYDGNTFTEPSFNSALVLKPTPVDSVRVSVARGVKIPGYYELFPQPVDTGFQAPSLQGNPTINPTIVMNYEVDWDRALPRLDSKLQMSVFHQTSRDLLALPGDGGSGALAANNIAYSNNIGSSVTDGAEISFSGSNAAGWRWKSGYALLFITDDLIVNRDTSVPESSVDYERGAAKHVVTLGLGRSWRDFEVDVASRWQSAYDDLRVLGALPPARFHIKDYVTTSARVGYRLTEGVTVSLSGDQLNRTYQRTTSGPQTERRGLLSTNFKF
jgi:iron complex outermembrane receptor protein